MTDTTTPAANAADPITRAHEGRGAERGTNEHGMKPIAMAFMVGNAAVLAVFAMVVATGHLDLGSGPAAIGDVLLTSATAAPAN